MKTADLAIIIPTLNEEKFIGKLLDSISTQTVKPSELVIVDAQSQDKTIDEIKKRQSNLPQLKYFQVPKSTISYQRNLGVSKTKSANLLFLDADIVLSNPQTLENFDEEVKKLNPMIAAAPIFPDSQNQKDKIYFILMRLVFKYSQFIWPIIVGTNLYIRRDKFEKLQGFDEELKIGEDLELVHRLKKSGIHITWFEKSRILVSTRRLRREGYFNFSLKMIFAMIYCMIFGFKSNPIKYELGKH